MLFWKKSVGILGSICLLLVVTACSPTDGDVAAQEAPTVTPIPTAPAAARPTYMVQRGTVQEILEFTGRWLPRDQVQLSFEISGTVRSVNVQRGDTVSAGELIASFDTTDLEDQLASAELDLQTAQRRLASSDGGTAAVRDAEFNLAGANLDLQSANENYPWTSLVSAQIELENAERDLVNARRSYDDARSHPDASASQVDSAYENLQSAEQRVRSALNSYYSAAQQYNNYTYTVARAENSVVRNQIALDEARQGVGLDPDLLQAVDSAQLRIDQINAQIARASLYAPIDGIVLEVTILPADSVQAFQAVITLALPEPLEVNASMAFNDTQRLSVGMVGVCQEINRPDTAVQCAIRQIPLSSRDADQTVRVAASLDDVAMGQLIQVQMPLQVREDVLWLPPAAIRTFQNRTFVVIQTPDGERVSDVELGLQTDERVEILSGVAEGDVVVGP